MKSSDSTTDRRFAAGLPALLAFVLSACGGGSGGQGQMPPAVDVKVAIVESRSVIDWDDFTGRIQAVDEVEIRPRVAGYLQQTHFAEGALVEQGDLLFTIDDREYRAELASQQANVARAETRVDIARQELLRSEKLLEARAVSLEELEQRRGEVRQAEADLDAARAALDRAGLDLEFTRIRAPISGRIGEAAVNNGNLVSPGEPLLATLVSIDPIHVVFEGDESIYLKYQAKAASGERPSSRDVPNPVQVGLASDNEYPFRGIMDFVDNKVDPATGTIQGRALIQNPDGFLIPGLFARVRLLGSGEYEALLIHEAAVMNDQDRRFVYVVNDENQAVRRDVRLGREFEGLRVVDGGLEAGERIIVSGVRKIFFSGAPVRPSVVPMNDPSGLSQQDAAENPSGPAGD